MGWQIWQQKFQKLFNLAILREPFHILTISLLGLILPLSFLLLARISYARYLLTLDSYSSSTQDTTSTSSFVFSLSLYANPALLYFLVSIVSIATLIHCLTGKLTLITNTSTPTFRPKLYTAWIFLCTLQVCVGLGIQRSIPAESTADGGFGFDTERSLFSRVIFFLGLHETMFHWCRVVVKPVVDDTVFGVYRKESLVEKVAVAVSFGSLWYWRLRGEIDSLVIVGEAKRELPMGMGMADFVGWWLYYLTVTIGMVRIVKGILWFSMILICRRRIGENLDDHTTTDEEKGLNST
ncbi:uncharacterized protein LOC107426125 [Ziziphus jujuba]|uniref:Uncharacterized protein LOC107426125 n=1 Tax=Ziziphus jujuba TaxID=326968 RepID=A0A6P4ARK0_ZIZJJ|nr:uncharacterized protein LOC107426125 [Ziziphus jujuba]